jgi:PAS domain S-box-containing protein
MGSQRDETAGREGTLGAENGLLGELIEASTDVFWLFDGEFEELLFVNDAYKDVWGRSTETLRDDPSDFLNGVHPDDREKVQEAMGRLTEGEAVEVEFRVNAEEEFGRWVSVRGEPKLDADGTVERIAGFTRDVTERKAREQELERRERQFEAVFNDPQLVVGLLNPDGTVRRVNETALKLAETDPESVEGTPFPETAWWSHDADLRDDLRGWIERAAAGEYVEFEASQAVPENTEMFVNGVIRPVTDETGEVVSLIASGRDITERKEHERQLEQSNRRLEQFAYVASHDLQEPLRTISNYTELLAAEYEDAFDEEAERFVDVIVTGSERMQSMVNGLLDYSRVTTRGDEFEPVDTERVVEEVADGLELLLEEYDGTLRWESLPTIAADGDQFGRLVQNLVENALEHGGDEPVEVEIRASEEPDHYRFEVADDGVGIEPSRHDKIFRIFKSGTSYQTSSQARGIGLAICDNIVQRHDGEIWVESESGQGATFVFTIPKREYERETVADTNGGTDADTDGDTVASTDDDQAGGDTT